MAPGRDIRTVLLGGQVPEGFESWSLAVPAGTARSTDPAEWAGALVLIEGGAIEVDCGSGNSRRFAAGDILALGWLPITAIRNPGTEDARLRAVRRRGAQTSRRGLARVRAVPG